VRADVKRCTKCGEVKPLSEFHVHQQGRFGRHPSCKACVLSRRRVVAQELPCDVGGHSWTRPGATGRPPKNCPDHEPSACGVKRCTRCKEIKPVGEFTTRPAARDGLYEYCKPCAGVVQRPAVLRWNKENRLRWRKENADKVRGYQRSAEQRRRAQKAIGDGGDYGLHWRALAERDGMMCYLCGVECTTEDRVPSGKGFRTFGRYPTLDHVVPLSRGGTHTFGNAKLACWDCNISKGAHTVTGV
jgi:5-methylcytosine-specific restriction endonuclease McrA